MGRRVPELLLLLLLLLAGRTLVAGQFSFPSAASAEQQQARERCFCQVSRRRFSWARRPPASPQWGDVGRGALQRIVWDILFRV